MQSNGISLAEIGTIQALFWAGLTVAEIPTGYLGDRFGRKASLAVATGLIAVAIVGHWFVQNFLGFVAVYVLWATGVTFRSGSLGAWLYDTLDERLDSEEFARIRGRGGSVVLGMSAVGSLAGAALYRVDPLYPFVGTATLALIGLAVLWTFPTPKEDDEDADSADGESDTLEFLEALRTARTHLTSRHLRWFVVYSGVLYVAHQVVSTFIQPTALAVGIGVGQLGVLYAVITGLSAVASSAAGWVKDTIGIEGWFTVAPLIVALPLLATLTTPLIALPAIAGVRFVDKLSGALRKQYVNDRTPSVGRATVLSAVSMVFGVVTIPARIAGGIVSETTSLFVMLAGLGAVVVLTSAWVYFGTTPFTDQPAQPAGGD